MFVTCHTLCPLQSLLLGCSWLCQLTREYVPNYNDAISEILDLRRDLHENNFALCEEYTSGSRTLLFVFSFCRPVLNAGGLHPPTFDTATFRVCVLAEGMRFLATHGIASSTGTSNFFLAYRITALNSSTWSGDISWIFLLWRAAWIFGVSMSYCCFNFLWARLDMDGHTSCQIASGVDITFVSVNLPFSGVHIWFWLPHDVNVFWRRWESMIIWPRHGGDKSIHQTYSRNLPFPR